MSQVYWFTGQPGHGKTVNATELATELRKKGKHVIHIDGDEIRVMFNNTDYSEEGRRKNVMMVHDLVYFLNYKNVDVVVSMVSPYLEQRELLKRRLGDNIIEVYVHTSEIRGREDFHVKNYEKPIENFLDLDTTNITIQECITKILNYEYEKLHSQS